MPPKRPPPSEEPLQASSSEEEDSSEEEELQIGSQQPYSATPLQSKRPLPDSDDSGSESEPDNTNVKPIASKPMDGPKPSSSKPSAVVAASPSRTPKRAKKKDLDDGVSAEKSVDSAKKQLFQRLFSEDDEIALLKGMIEFAAKKGKDPVVFIEFAAKKGRDPVVFLDEFHEFIKKSIHIDVTRAQLLDKIRRLKKKFKNNVAKAKEGKDRTFTNAHEQKTYDLSKHIWGREKTSGDVQAVDNGNVKSNERVAKDTTNVETERERNAGAESRGGQVERIDKSVSGPGLEGYVLNKGLDLVEGEKRVELEKKWRTLQVEELELFARRAELISEQAKLVLEAYKSMDT